ncbi:hypothetical protein DUI87_01003 [Hirundo rustica rustica]|uniref:ribonuclease H n=1 Tax=Hirundo rustica rustica TaxID=333673 RepID=A0A3M0LM64_HIRRU|nr:hypothetical protein DUI87_01003 [Hirundo rustica rustica]
MHRHTTLDPGSDEGTQQLINLFLGQSTGDIRRKLQKIRGPNSWNLETLLDEAWRVFSNREEGYKQGMKKLAAVVKEGEKGKHGQGPPKQGPPRLGKDQCAFYLKDAFFCLPLHEASQKIFAFEWESPKTRRKTQLTWCVLPQGYKNSPTILGEQLAKDLESWEPPPGEGQLLQYVDDLLIATRTQETCVDWTVSLLNFLGLQGYRVSQKKAQMVRQTVIHLGYKVSAGQRTLGQDRKEAICQTPKPQTVKELRTFLGMTGWCRLWIYNYGLLVKPLYALITEGSRDLQWTKEATRAFDQLKKALMSAPALGLPYRFLKYQAILVEQDDVEIVVTNIVNPASFVSGSTGEPVIHDCLETIEATYSSRPDLKDTPLEDADTWFTDGSSYVVSGRRHAGYAVTTSREDGFHEAYHPPMKLIRVSPECCDKCLSTCLEFRLKIEGCAIKGYDIDFNITQVCTEYHKNQTKITPPVPRKAVITKMPAIPEVEEQITPVVTKIGPYAIKKTGVQKLIVNPKWSLKRVEMGVQVNASHVRPECAPFLRNSFMDWTTWLQKSMPPNFRNKRHLTGLLGTGLGVLNTIDSEVLLNKLTTIGSDLVKLQQPLQSSLLALGNNHWKLTKILPEWEDTEERDHEVIINALGTASENISLALGCTQAQLWMQSVAAAVIREGGEGIFPAEIRKIVWDNASDMERELQSWWMLVNFTYNPVTSVVTAFVLTIHDASVDLIHPIVPLGLNHEGTVLYPSEHRMWALEIK